MSNVVKFPGITRLDMDPERVLEAAVGRLEGVVVLGLTKDGEEEYFASSYADGGTVMWLLERCKKKLLEAWDSE